MENKKEVIPSIFTLIVSQRDLFLTPKRSDRCNTFLYVDGWRHCSVVVGSKKAKIKPLHGNFTTKTLTVSKLKEELYSTYEHAVRFVVGRLERKPRNWRRTYGLRT